MAEFREQVQSAAERQEVLAALDQLYGEVQKSIEQRRPVCSVSGRCCRFEEFGHRLFVTTIEMAGFIAQLGSTRAIKDWDGAGCPFQINRLCSVHAIRPFGCRMFFCDATAGQWQNEQYELFHGKLKSLHESLQVPYFYVEWREALRLVAGDITPAL